MEKEAIEALIDRQRKWCFKDFLQIDIYQTDRAKFYRNVLGAVFSVIGISVVVFGGLVAWSYAPIKDIAALKAEVRILNRNVDKLLQINGQKVEEVNMDYNNPCPECGYKISQKIDKAKRQCLKCANIYTIRILEKAETPDPGREASRQVAILKNPILNTR